MNNYIIKEHFFDNKSWYNVYSTRNIYGDIVKDKLLQSFNSLSDCKAYIDLLESINIKLELI